MSGKTVVLPEAKEMMERLIEVYDDEHTANYIYEPLLFNAGRKVTATGSPLFYFRTNQN